MVEFKFYCKVFVWTISKLLVQGLVLYLQIERVCCLTKGLIEQTLCRLQEDNLICSN